MLELRDIGFAYSPVRPVLSGVNLRLEPGESLGLLAPSGSGKSTLLRIAALLLAPRTGTVSLAGVPVTGTRYAIPPAIRRTIGLVGQSPRASTNPRLSLAAIIAEPLSQAAGRRTPRPAEDRERISELAEMVQLSTDLLERHPHQVSDGQLQRAALARALALDPGLLVCDEPTAMLDATTTALIIRLVGERVASGAAALIASHDRALLEAGCTTTATLAGLSPADR